MRNLHPRSSFLRAVPLLLLAGACDFPTEVPQWQTLWVIPADSSRVEVASFFPSGVQATADRSAFVVSLPAISIQRTLGEMCGTPCQAVNGATVPKPAFTVTLSSSSALPADVVSAALTGGRVNLSLSHDLSFDPIRPSATARGFIVITATSGGATLARDSISGDTTSFAANSTLTRTLNLSAATVSGPVTINVTLNSPAGDPIRVDTSQRLTVSATLADIRASQAEVRMSGARTVTGDTVVLKMGGIDDALIERVDAGALRLEIDNPFAAQGTLRLAFRQVSTGPFDKTITVPAGASETRVEFTGQEIRALLNSDEVLLILSGTFTAPSGTLTIRPSQIIRVDSDLELLIGIGG